jgi:hypothetical protein
MVIPVNTSIQQQLASQYQGNPFFLPWDQTTGQFGRDPGSVFIDDFDLGIVRTMGAIVDASSPVNEPAFVLLVKGLKPEGQRELEPLEEIVVPVTFGHPESYMSIWKLPGIFIHRDQIEPDLQRYSQELEGFRLPAPNTKYSTIETPSGDVTGPNEVYSKIRAEAYNFYYNIDLIARYRTDANMLLRNVLPSFKQHKSVIVQDSKGEFSQYTAFLEGIDQLDEIIGVTMKHHGYSLTLKIIGELDVAGGPDGTGYDIRPTTANVDLEVAVKQPGETAPIQTNADGLPLKTEPADYLGSICSHVKRKSPAEQQITGE